MTETKIRRFVVIALLFAGLFVFFHSCHSRKVIQEEGGIDTFIISHPLSVTDSTTAEFRFTSSVTEGVVEFVCNLDGNVSRCYSDRVTYTDLSVGKHLFKVYSVWVTGGKTLKDLTPAEFEWRVVPDTYITDRPPFYTSRKVASFSFTSSYVEATFQCKVDNSPWQSCVSPFEIPEPPEGKHHFEVRAVDSEGFADITPAKTEWVEDYTPPAIEIIYAPVDYSNEFTGGFVLQFIEPVVRLQWQFDDEDWNLVSISNEEKFYVISYHDLTTGAHKLKIEGIDIAGNIGETSYIWHLYSRKLTGVVRKLSIEGMTPCAIEEPGRLWCWGYNVFGGAGVGGLGYGEVKIPENPVSDDDWVDISTHLAQSCGIKADGTLWCWGIVPESKIIADLLAPYPVQIYGSKKWKKVSTGLVFTCGITEDSSLVCWNIVDKESLGDEIITPLTENEKNFGGGWKEVSSGYFHICGIKDDNTLWCWGSNQYGELGVGESYGDYVSYPVEVGGEWLKVSSGYHNTCGIKLDGSLWCWGDASDGKLGIGVDEGIYSYPQEITTAANWIDVAVGAGNVCGVTQDNKLYCWGRNGFGEIDDSGKMVLWPKKVWEGVGWSQVSVGGVPQEGYNCFAGDTVCGVTTGGKFRCWGLNNYGQHGDGTAEWIWCAVPLPAFW